MGKINKFEFFLDLKRVKGKIASGDVKVVDIFPKPGHDKIRLPEEERVEVEYVNNKQEVKREVILILS